MMKSAKPFVRLNVDDDVGSFKVPKNKIPNVISGSKAAMEGQGRGVVYLSHIPHGFHEKQMQNFFSQFGSITNLRLGRSKKTGVSRGFAFIEFRFADVARIVAETMNNYLMFEKLLKCKLVPQEDVKASMFKKTVDPLWPAGAQARYLAKKKNNSTRTKEQEERRARSLRRRTLKTTQKLAQLGIEIPSLEMPMPASTSKTVAKKEKVLKKDLRNKKASKVEKS